MHAGLDPAEIVPGCTLGVIQSSGTAMNSSVAWQLALFVAVLIGLNFFFHLHISILGSLLLTVGLNLAFDCFGPDHDRQRLTVELNDGRQDGGDGQTGQRGSQASGSSRGQQAAQRRQRGSPVSIPLGQPCRDRYRGDRRLAERRGLRVRPGPQDHLLEQVGRTDHRLECRGRGRAPVLRQRPVPHRQGRPPACAARSIAPCIGR